MELLYVWCDNINKDKMKVGEFNFGGKYTFKVNGGNLECKENKQYIKDFFQIQSRNNKVLNITAIVGANGDGKTSSIKAIIKSAFNTRNYNPSVGKIQAEIERYIAIFFNGNKVYIYKADNIEINLDQVIEKLGRSSVKEFIIGKSGCNEETVMAKTMGCFYSGVVTKGGSYDDPYKHNRKIYVSNYEMGNESIANTLEMLNELAEIKSMIDFDMPEIINIATTCAGYEEIHQQSFDNPSYRELDKAYFKELKRLISFESTGWNEFGVIKHQLLYIVTTYVFLIRADAEVNISTQMIEELRCLEVDKCYLKNCYNVLDIVKEYVEEKKEKYVGRTDKLIELIEYIRKIPIDNNVVSESSYNTEMRMFELQIDEKNEINATRFLKLYKEVFDNYRYLDLHIRNCSSGEYALLELITYFYKLKNGIVKSVVGLKEYSCAETMVLFIDEGDVYFHPSWQRKYINNLIKLLPMIFSEKDFQLIITTNRPIILSDLPENNIIYLKNNEKDCEIDPDINIKTFAQNIHTLFTHSFFMKDGLLGEFATEKIKSIIKILRTEENHEKFIEKKDEIHYVIENIGEPLLRRKLQELFDEKNDHKSSLISKLNSLKTERETLTKNRHSNSIELLDKEIVKLKRRIEKIDDKNRC